MTAADAFKIASQYYQTGQIARAEQMFRYVLKLDPNHAAALHDLSKICYRNGDTSQAVDFLKKSLRLAPGSVEGYGLLAKALAKLGRLEEAAVSLQQMVALAPADSAGHANLGVVLGMQGRHDEAITCLRRVVALNPAHAEAQNNLGEALRRLGRHDEATRALREAISLKPNLAEAHNNLGLVLFKQDRFEEALSCYRTALSISPHYAEAHNNRGSTLRAQGNLEAAHASFQHALRLQPDYVEAHNNLGLVLRDQNRLEEARACIEHALHLRPTFADAHCNLGELRQELGDLKAAADCFREAIQLEPRHPVALANLALLLRGQLPQSDLDCIHDRLADPLLNENERICLLFGLAHVLDERAAYRQAAAHLEMGNALEQARWHKRGRPYNPQENARVVDKLQQSFTPEFFQKARNWGVVNERPVFVFGLPRSGTSLIEQILASHSQVHGGGELPFAMNGFKSLSGLNNGPAEPSRWHDQATIGLECLDETRTQRLAHEHLHLLTAVNATAVRVTDKMPANWRYLGLLAILFPKARFIHCRRDVRDVAVSCWMTRFQHLNWTCDFNHIASYFHDYRQMMIHWRACLPVPMLEIDYEETVADLAGTSRRLFSWLGLEYEEACVNFHQTRRPVRTASASQVRQPLYRSSVGRWQHYADVLGPLFRQLEHRAHLDPLLYIQSPRGES